MNIKQLKFNFKYNITEMYWAVRRVGTHRNTPLVSSLVIFLNVIFLILTLLTIALLFPPFMSWYIGWTGQLTLNWLSSLIIATVLPIFWVLGLAGLFFLPQLFDAPARIARHFQHTIDSFDVHQTTLLRYMSEDSTTQRVGDTGGSSNPKDTSGTR